MEDIQLIILLTGTTQLVAIAWLVIFLARRDRKQEEKIENIKTEATEIVPTKRAKVALCKSVTFFYKDEVDERGKMRRETFHTSGKCPERNTNKSREQLMKEFEGRKYSFNTHRIER